MSSLMVVLCPDVEYECVLLLIRAGVSSWSRYGSVLPAGLADVGAQVRTNYIYMFFMNRNPYSIRIWERGNQYLRAVSRLLLHCNLHWLCCTFFKKYIISLFFSKWRKVREENSGKKKTATAMAVIFPFSNSINICVHFSRVQCFSHVVVSQKIPQQKQRPPSSSLSLSLSPSPSPSSALSLWLGSFLYLQLTTDL